MIGNQQSGRKGTLFILAYYFPPENTSGAARPFRFAKYLNHFGYNSQVVCAGEGQDRIGPIDICRTPSQTDSLTRVGFASRAAGLLERIFLPYNDRLPWVPHAAVAAAGMLSSGPFSAVLSTSPPVATHIAGLYLKARFGVKWIADFRDPLLGNPFRTKRRGGFYDTSLERFIFRRADAIIANTDRVAQIWSDRYPQWREKISVIWNGFDPDETVQPSPIPPQKFQVLGHVGDIYGGRHPGILLSSVERLVSQGLLDSRRLRIRLVGPLDEDSIVHKMSEFHSLIQRGCLEYNARLVPRAEAVQATAAMDFLLLLDVNEKGFSLQVPAKIFDYIRIGRPILAITARNSPAHQILLRSGVPFTCLFKGDSTAETDEKVLSFLNLSTDPVTASPWFWNQFNASAHAEALASILGRLEDRRRTSDSYPDKETLGLSQPGKEQSLSGRRSSIG